MKELVYSQLFGARSKTLKIVREDWRREREELSGLKREGEVQRQKYAVKAAFHCG